MALPGSFAVGNTSNLRARPCRHREGTRDVVGSPVGSGEAQTREPETVAPCAGLFIVGSDGRWNLALRNRTFNELVNAWIAAGLVVLLNGGVPALIYLVWVLQKG